MTTTVTGMTVVGSYVLQLAASDSLLTGTDTVTITVNSGNTAPVISGIALSAVAPNAVTGVGAMAPHTST